MGENKRSLDDVQNVRDKSLSEQYEPHDLLQSYVENKLQAWEYTVEQFGIDDRHSDELKYSGKPDLCVSDDGTLVAYVEVKSKRITSDEWFGRLNRRHWDNYLYGSDEFDGAEETDVPVFLYFGVVDEETQLVIRDGFIEVSSESQVEDGFVAYGNVVIELDETDVRNMQWLDSQLRGDGT